VNNDRLWARPSIPERSLGGAQRWARITHRAVDEHEAECLTCRPNHPCSIMAELTASHERAKAKLQQHVNPEEP
jgi:hypothetical protein